MVRDQSKIPCGFLWEKTDSRGKKYLAGSISLGIFGEIPIGVFKEDDKATEKSADYVIRNMVNERTER